MIVEDQTRLKAFQDAQTAYASFLRRRSQGERVSFGELISEHEALEPILVGLHETFRQTESQAGSPQNAATSPAGGTTTVVDRRRRDGRLEALAAEGETPTAPRTGRSATDKRYVPQGELARGGMGAILKVWDRDLGRTLAMKVLLDESSASRGRRGGADHLARFLQEAQVIARLDHPGIVPVHDVGFDQEGRPYFTMRYVDGLDLDAVFDRARADRDGWNLSRAVASIVKTCQTMAYAHARGIIHRDLKPGNVMVGRFGEVYVIDWGLTKILHGQILHGRGADDETLIMRRLPGSVSGAGKAAPQPAPRRARRSVQSGDGVVVGTPPFMPPEQAEGLGKALDPRSDIYSLGAILYTLLTGRAPYAPLDGGAVSAPEMTDRVLEGPPTPVRELAERAPARLVAICERAMARDPSDRYRSAIDMAEDLQSYLDGRSVVPSPGVVARVREWANGNRAVAGFAGVAVFLMTLLPGIVAVSPDADESRSVPEQALQEAPPRPEAEPAKERCVAKSTAECGDAQSS